MDERWILVLALLALGIYYVNASACGNAVIEEGEFCDINRLSSNCTNFNYTGGSLLCLDDCSGYDFNQCTGEEVCGNGIISGSEICELENTRGRTCLDEGYEGGNLKCRSDCVRYDYKECTGVKSICGDENITGKEECDVILGNKNCTDFDYDSGVLRCNANCTFNFGYCFKEIVVEENISVEENNISEEVNITNQDVNEEINNNESKKVKLSSVLIVFLVLIVAGILIIYLYIFKIRK